MTTLVATDAALSGSILKTDAVFATAWNAVNGDSIDQTNMYVGIRNVNYDLYRMALLFDTTAIPANAIIYSAYIELFQFMGFMSSENLVVQNGQPTYPHNPVVVGDYDKTNYADNGGSIPMDDVILPQYRVIPLNATGFGWINKGGFSKFMLRSQPDIDGIINYACLRFMGPLASFKPKLVVNYVVPGQAMTVVASKDCDGIVWNGNANYATCRTAAAGTVDTGVWNFLNIGQSNSGTYYISRAFLFFDTSGIQIGANIADVQLVMTGLEDHSDNNFDITVQSGQPTYPSYPLLQATDYDMTKYAGNYGTFNTAGFVVEGENRISLSTDFILNQLVVGGVTKICLRSSRDIAGTAPGLFQQEFVDIYSGLETNPYKKPRLEITFVGGRVAEAPGLIDIGWKAAQRGY